MDSEIVEKPRAVVELFVKTGLDRSKLGGCPLCHRYFLAFYILREQGLIDLVVTIFLPENAPKELLAFSNGKHYPVVKVHSGFDFKGENISGLECDSIDDIEALLDRFGPGKRKEKDGQITLEWTEEYKEELRAMKVFEDLYLKFMSYLRDVTSDKQALEKTLERLEDYLRNRDSKYLLSDTLTRPDCYLIPTLQHIRVAGKVYRNFEIPTHFTAVWNYITNVYNTEAFAESCPADREIINQYELKTQLAPKLLRRSSSLLGDDRTLSIPQAERSMGIPQAYTVPEVYAE